ncbi:SDR family NAD(P)-dependent oxidoreductase [Aurantiacibacter sp. MUD61]|uniref:SDR family NAD(P)-dependent oxidoreductase n=1 Tax=Aurantiacibacter sp. MUD61 TaxID=3009083 RepID=UPI0022F0D258|nr:SDR family oxidoreductase [Aurantiacibacter sp. MUD61]
MTPDNGSAVYPSLAGKRVVISGGGSGIGAGIVEAFARQGARVGFVDIATEESEALVERLSSAQHVPVFRECDITGCDVYIAALEELFAVLGGCDVLVNNAACDDRHSVTDVDEKLWDDAMAVNLKHQFFAARAAAPQMESAGGGSIINLGSISWHLGLQDLVVYQTAKAAIEGMTRGLARELGPKNIRVNTIVPGNVKTPRQAKWYTPEGEAEIVAAQCLEGRLEPHDVAAMALFLASDDARLCTAHNYWVDAGWR